MRDKERSPFTPGRPAPPDLLVGRDEEIQTLMAYLGQARQGKQDAALIVAERGLGKSSLAAFIKEYAERHDMLGAHVFAGQIKTVEELCRVIFEDLANSLKRHGWYENVKGLFGDYIQEVDLFGMSIKFQPSQTDLELLARRFPEALHNLLQGARDEMTGAVIVIDDINGLAADGYFANWFKSVIDSAATAYADFPVLFVVVGLPENRDKLFECQPSLRRIFRYIHLSPVQREDRGDFFIRAFSDVNTEVEADALKTLVTFSGGLPIVMQELGESTFWQDNDSVVDRTDALTGVMDASRTIGHKYIEPRVFDALRSPRYHSILQKLAREGVALGGFFSKKELSNHLDENEKKVYDNFLKAMRRVEVLRTDGAGNYEFTNPLYDIYLGIRYGQS